MARKHISDRTVCLAAFAQSILNRPNFLGRTYDFLRLLAPREVPKVCERAIERAIDHGYLDWGVSVASSYLTDKGKDYVKEATEELAVLLIRASIVLKEVAVEGYAVEAKLSSHGYVYLQGSYDERCVVKGVVERQYTRRWMLTPHMTQSEIVFTALKMVITSYEHRAREAFTYKGARIGSPHFDVEDLVKLNPDGGGR